MVLCLNSKSLILYVILSLLFPIICRVGDIQIHHMNLNSFRETNHLLIKCSVNLSSIRMYSLDRYPHCSDQSRILFHRIITILIEMVYLRYIILMLFAVNILSNQDRIIKPRLKGQGRKTINKNILLC